jgi:hypothetical protein
LKDTEAHRDAAPRQCFVVRTVRAARLSIVAAKAKAFIMRISARPAAIVRFEIQQFDHQRFHVPAP